MDDYVGCKYYINVSKQFSQKDHCHKIINLIIKLSFHVIIDDNDTCVNNSIISN